jgi:Cys-tRNA(Pro)/Cys-tRNA(Cys) deacylase
VMVPGDRHLSLKKLEGAVGFKGLRMATLQEAEKLTGLKVGGISALELLGRRFDVFIDSSALQYEKILVSAGKRGINIRLPVNELIRITNATPVDVAV